jgi:hypothetical protein
MACRPRRGTPGKGQAFHARPDVTFHLKENAREDAEKPVASSRFSVSFFIRENDGLECDAKLLQGFTRALERELQRFFRYTGDERTNQPTKPFGDVAGERDGFQLDVHALISLPEVPIGIKPP